MKQLKFLSVGYIKSKFKELDLFFFTQFQLKFV
jgi:hypothetical protein